MSMKSRWIAWPLLVALGSALGAGPAVADHDDEDKGGKRKGRAIYEVAITNLTKDQVFSPPVIVTHTSQISVFEGGQKASAGLVLVAEDGKGELLADDLGASREVFEALATGTPVMPGHTEVFEIEGRGRFDRISVVSMLVNTNDAFLGVDSQPLPTGRGSSHGFAAPGYDAGSEANNEDCGSIPGPACPEGSGNARDPEEGVVHVHNGVHGVGDLAPAAYDWRNPVARVVVTRMR